MELGEMLTLKYKLRILIYFTGLVLCSQGAYLRYYRSSLEDYKETKLEHPLNLLSWIDCAKPTLFYAFGFNNTPHSDDTKMVTSAFLKRNDINFILVNWKREAENDQLEGILAHALTATPNSKIVGRELGISLLQLACHLDMSTVHLVGHSLGAHLVGYAGLQAKERGVVVPRITGLEPSSTKYEGFEHSYGINSSSASFVAIWHTNPGNYGTTKSLGHVDVWFNCACDTQPGCAVGHFPFSDSRSSCSHRRSVEFFAESINSPESFIAIQAASCSSWSDDNSSICACDDDDTINVNLNIDTSVRGNYYLSTNAQKPYGKGWNGVRLK